VKKFLILAMAMVLALGMIGSAFAYFTDVETSTGNIFAAGTLDLDCVVTATCNDMAKVTINENVNGLNDNVVFNNLAPGDSGVITWTLTNIGTMPGKLDVLYQGVNDYDSVNPDPELAIEPGATATTPGELNDNMHLSTRYFLNDIQQPYTWVGYMSICTPVWTHADSFPKNLPALSVYKIEWTWWIDNTVGNIIQGDSFTLNFAMSLDQIP